jgi:hypothetical protein
MNTDRMYDGLGSVKLRVDPRLVFGSACGPVIVPVFKSYPEKSWLWIQWDGLVGLDKFGLFGAIWAASCQ